MDAIPDLSENQVIVFVDWMGRSPQEIEDQVTYPLSVSLQGLAGVKAVRSSSEFTSRRIRGSQAPSKHARIARDDPPRRRFLRSARRRGHPRGALSRSLSRRSA